MATVEKLEIVRCGPYRFIGKAMYVRAGESDDFCAFAFGQNWVFEKLDNLKEYAAEDIHDSALVTWDKYDEKNKLMGYTVGRFMKADTPVPNGMDYIDIPEGYVGKCIAIGGNPQQILKDEAERQGYEAATWIWHAEIAVDRAGMLNGTPNHPFGFYIACNKK